MKALSIRQPIAYLAGCLLGDAWLATGTRRAPSGYLCLRVADQDFADAFAAAITAGFSVPAKVNVDERGFYLVRKSNGGRRFDVLRGFEPLTNDARAAWLRGFFDSEGNVVCAPKPAAGPRSWDRRVSMFSTNQDTLWRARRALSALNIEAKGPVEWKGGAGRYGSKQVFAVVLISSWENYVRFGDAVGSSIGRKAAALATLPGTYQDDLKACAREAQQKGVQVRLARKAAGGRY